MELTAEDVAGRWQIARQIDDRRAGEAGTFAGTAEFTGGPVELRYLEEGELTMGGRAPLRAARSYVWRFTPAGVELYFDDGRFFHAIGADGRGEHPCGEDLYRVRYDFSGWPAWQAEWRVVGPRKDYVLRSRYTRP
ncbi:DUF6314 family protein [Pseudoroseicyclus tamaricis]|uniref:DUF6314 domain-containing protein n=1 Tax=Pseudoroseicyclus tamaricis TaxID=2705421 RepID=A0A6B2JWK2_9RHOB|nr:DUF6314 family protein [Pseudoroseicyclus tamaricis]NDV01039.1 hypothetical protein [Pseudoroseicyclus tamaricis]